MQTSLNCRLLTLLVVCVLLGSLTSLCFAKVDISRNSHREISVNNVEKIIEIETELRTSKKDMLDHTILAYNRSSDSANRLISIIGFLSATFGILIAIASVVVGYISITSKKRRDEAIQTLDGAKEYIEKQVKVFDTQIEIRLNELNKKVDEAIQIMLLQLSQDTEDAVKLVSLGAEQVSQKINQSAEEIAIKIKAITEKDVENGTAEKLQYLDRKVKLFEELGIPDDPNFLYSKAIIFKEKKQFITATELLEKLVKIDPQHRSAFWNLGSLYHVLKQYEKAITAYDKAIELKPNDDSAFHNKALILRTQGKIDSAIENYDKAIAIKGDSPLYYRNKAKAYTVNEENIAEITKCYNKSLELEPDNPDTLLEIGRLLNNFQKYDAARNYYMLYTNRLEKEIMSEDANESDVVSYYEGLILTERYDEALSLKDELCGRVKNLKYKIVFEWLTGCVYLIKNNIPDGIGVMNSVLDEKKAADFPKVSWNFEDVYPLLGYKLDKKEFNLCDCVKRALLDEISVSVCKTTVEGLYNT